MINTNLRTNLLGNKTYISDYKKYKGLSKKETDTLVALARKGASIGQYMGEETGCRFIREYVEKNVTPDYSGIKNHILRCFNSNHSRGQLINYVCKKYRNYTFSCQMSRLNDFAVVYDHTGEQVLNYDSRSGWFQASNKEEMKAYHNLRDIYYSAYIQARDEMRSQGFLTQDGKTIPGFDPTIRFEPTTGIEIPASKFDSKV